MKINKALKSFDKTAVKVVIWTGTLWILLKIITLLIVIVQARQTESPTTFYQNVTWLIDQVWVQILFWIILPQLLRIKLVSRYLIPRIIIAFFFAFSFERIIRLYSNFHRDYLPSNLSTDISMWQLLPSLLFKTLIFTIIIAAFHYTKRFLYGDDEE